MTEQLLITSESEAIYARKAHLTALLSSIDSSKNTVLQKLTFTAIHIEIGSRIESKIDSTSKRKPRWPKFDSPLTPDSVEKPAAVLMAEKEAHNIEFQMAAQVFGNRFHVAARKKPLY